MNKDKFFNEFFPNDYNPFGSGNIKTIKALFEYIIGEIKVAKDEETSNEEQEQAEGKPKSSKSKKKT